MNKPLFNTLSCLWKIFNDEECGEVASYVAKDNRAKYGHICERHHRMLPRVKQDHYARKER